MQTLETLVHEHQVIERGLAVLQAVAGRVQKGEEISTERVRELLQFFQVFADKCHHAKEEGVLFPAIEERGIPRDGGPIGVMLYEHDRGRGYVREMIDALPRLGEDAAAKEQFLSGANHFVSLLSEHIFKENNVLFRMAESVLSDEDDKRLMEQFERHEREVVGEGEHERLHNFIHEIEHEFLG
jgi:hemerythrin-like domain-containing protein